jgi:hypothetical protein
MFEAMEGRQMLSSIELNSGVLTLTADTGRTNDINVWAAKDGSQMWPTINGVTKTYYAGQVQQIVINTGSSSDKVSVDSNAHVPYNVSNNQWQSSGGTAGSASTTSGISVNNGVLSVVGKAGQWNDISLWLSGDGNTTWVTLNGATKTYSAWDYSSVQIVKGTATDNVAVDGRAKATITTASASTGSTGGGTTTTTAPTPTQAGINVVNGVLQIVGDPYMTNDIQVWATPDGQSSWITLNSVTKGIATSQFNSIQVVKGTANDKVIVDSRLNKPSSITTASGSTTGGSTGSTGGTTTTPTQVGVNIVNGVLQIVGDPTRTNTIDLWASNDGGVVWPALNGNTKQYNTSDFNSVLIVKGTADDKVMIDSRLKKPSSTTLGSGAPTGGTTGGSTGTNTGGTTTAPTDPGISVANNVLTIVGYANTTNDIQVWATPDGQNSWVTLNNVTKGIATSQFSSVRVVKASDADKVVVDSRLNKPTTITTGTSTGGNTGGGTTTTPTPTPPPSTNTGPNPQANITMVSGTSILAGRPVNAQAMDSVLNAGSPITAKYEWDFGDSNGRFNKLVGYNAAHIYDQPGTYTLTLKVTNENGGTSTTTRQISVAADNRATIYVDAYGGNDGNNGSSEYSAVQSIARASQLLADNKKVLFKRGQTFGTDNGLWAVYSNVTVGAYGSGSDPVLKWTGSNRPGIALISDSAYTTKNLVIQNLQFDVSQPGADNMPDAYNAHGCNVAIRNCTFLNISSAINANGAPKGLLVQDNSQPTDNGMMSYFVWLEGSDAVIIGNTSANSTRQHNIRAADGFNRALIEYNTLTNLDRRNVDSGDFSKTTLNIQDGTNMYIRGNTLTGGTVRIGPLGGADGVTTYPNTYLQQRTTNTVIEGNTINGADIQLVHGSENTMIRNNVIHYDDHAAIETEAPDPTYNYRQVVNAYILNNTSYNNSTHGNFLWINGQAGGIVLDNNLYVAPNMEVGGWQTSPIFVGIGNLSMFAQINGNVWQTPKTSGWGVDGGVNIITDGTSMTGYKTPSWWNGQYMVGDDAFSNTPIGGDYKPGWGSVASTYGKKVAGVMDDFYGTARPSNGIWSAGAVQA